MMKFLKHVANIYRVSGANKASELSIAYNMFTNNIRDSVELKEGEDKYFYDGAVGIHYPDLYPELAELEGEINAFRSWADKHYLKLAELYNAGDFDGITAFAEANPTIPFHPFIYPQGVKDTDAE